MITRSQFAVAVGGLATIAGLVAYGTHGTQTTPPKLGDVSASARFLDVATPQQAGVLLAIVRHFDATMVPLVPPATSMPPAGMTPEQIVRFRSLPVQQTTHKDLPHPHPCVAGRWGLWFDAADRVEWAQLRAACAVRVDAGATGPCVVIAALPALVTTQDATWACVPDAGAVNPESPSDDYPGVTP